MSAALHQLSAGLRPFASRLQAGQPLSDPAQMVRARKQVEIEHGRWPPTPPPGTILDAVDEFRRAGTAATFRDLKYVCFGVSALDGEGRCLLSESHLLRKVTDLVARQREMRRRLLCFQALLSSYWTFPLNGRQTGPESKAGWIELREWLSVEHRRILLAHEPKPPWFAALTRHIGLLSDRPCDAFGAALMRGDPSGLPEAMESLSIPQDSWVMEEAVVAQMRAGCALRDGAFKDVLPDLIAIALGRKGIHVVESIKVRSVALLISRYARCTERPEHMALRDAAVSVIGNPWLRRPNWDAWVRDAAGKPDNQSREMVNGWLKRRLITDFFELLSVDGAGVRRRVEYWLRHEPAIEDMWFALGSDARGRRGEQFDDFRSRAKGRLLDLGGTTADNNAFVMRVGRYLLVEFGAHGNAMYVVDWNTLSEPLLDVLHSGRARAGVHIRLLRPGPDDYVQRMIHMDSLDQTWEEKFDAYLVPGIVGRPAVPPRRVAAGAVKKVAQQPASAKPQRRYFTPSNWEAFVREHKLQVVDHRASQGALWVRGAAQPRHIASQLHAWGFTRRDPKGWCKE